MKGGTRMHWECRYCDLGFRPIKADGDLVCESCGAEWESAKIQVKDEIFEEESE